MKVDFLLKQTGRREMLRNAVGLAGGALLGQLFPSGLYAAIPGVAGGRTAGFAAQGNAPAADPLAAIRAEIGGIPIQTHQLGVKLALPNGPVGKGVGLNG